MMNRTTSSGTINIPMMMNNSTANNNSSLVENTFHSPPTMMMMGGLPTSTTTPSSLSSNNSGSGSMNNSFPIPIPSSSSSSSSTLTFKRKTSNAKYKPANLSISSVRDSKASKPTKQFEIPQEFYMYSHASSVPNQGYISSVDEHHSMASPSPHSSSLITSAHYHNRSSSLQPQQPPSINNLFQKSNHHHGMGQRQHTPFSPPSTSSAMMIGRSSVSSISSSFSNSSYNPMAHSHSSAAAHHHSSSFVPNSLGHQYSSGYFNPHSYDNNSMCYSLSSSVESNCSYASHCISPNTGSLLLYDKLNRKFRKIRALGEGSSSTVSLVQQESTGLFFAEKVIEHYEERETIVKNEVKYLSICKPCPNVVTLYDCFQKGDSIHLILEYMEGNSLDIIAKQYSKLSKSQRKALDEETAETTDSSHLSPMTFDEDSELMTYDDDLDDLNADEEMFPMDSTKAKPEKKKSTRRKLFDDDEESDTAKNQNENKGLPEEMLALMIVQITRALCFLMDHNIIHSDIKPSNILLNRRGEVKLTDFGLSTCTDVSQNRLGSFAYMSPEKLQHGKHSHKSDIYSLGVSILELSKFKFPFSESGFHMNEIQHLDVDKFVGNTHSHEFKDFIRQCIQIEPNVRLCAHELLQHDWLRNYANMDNDLICSKISKWYNKLS